MRGAALEKLLRRDRVVVGVALAALVVPAWLYLFHLSHAMPDIDMPDRRCRPRREGGATRRLGRRAIGVVLTIAGVLSVVR